MRQESGLLIAPFLQMFKQTNLYIPRLIQDLKDNPACYLLIFTLSLFCTKTLVLFPFVLVSIIAVYYFARHPGYLTNQKTKNVLVLFLCLWLPMLASLPDAINYTESIRVTFSYLRFLLFGLFILIAIEPINRIKMQAIIVYIILFWCFDGLLQFYLGQDLFGYPYTPPQLMGMFYPKVRMPYILAVLAPIFFEYIRLYCGKYQWLLLVLIPFFMVLLLGGKRVAWFMMLFSGTFYLVYLIFIIKALSLKRFAPYAIVILTIMSILILNHTPLKNRVLSTTGIFSGDADVIEAATARRLSLWQVSVDIFRDNPINGVGPRGYREVFTKYANVDNFWMQNDRRGTTHPHMMLAEVASETGLFGLVGLLVFYYFLFSRIYYLIRKKKLEIVPWYICAATAFFPLNSHLAFYGSYWSSFCWWILITALAIDYAATEKIPDH